MRYFERLNTKMELVMMIDLSVMLRTSWLVGSMLRQLLILVLLINDGTLRGWVHNSVGMRMMS